MSWWNDQVRKILTVWTGTLIFNLSIKRISGNFTKSKRTMKSCKIQEQVLIGIHYCVSFLSFRFIYIFKTETDKIRQLQNANASPLWYFN